MTIKDELLALKNGEGLLVVEEVWDWAKANPKSELHGAITWDVDEAAKQYQFWQIRKLVKLHIVSEDREPQIISLSIDRTRPQGGYRPMDDVMGSPNLRSIALSDALREFERIQAKYQHLAELADVWSAIDKVRAKQTQQGAASHVAAWPGTAEQTKLSTA